MMVRRAETKTGVGEEEDLADDVDADADADGVVDEEVDETAV